MRDQHRDALVPAGPSNPAVRRFLAAKQGRVDQAVSLEGLWLLEKALAAGVAIEAVFVCSALARGPKVAAAASRAARVGAAVYEISERVLRRMVERDGPDGVAAIARRRAWSLDGLVGAHSCRIVVADGWDLPGNLGTMIRCADGAGAAAVLVSEPRVRVTHPLVMKASMGAALTHPVVPVERASAICWLRAEGFRIVAAEPSAGTSYRDVDYRGRVAIVVGSERHGLVASWREAADTEVSIPMLGTSDSLNAALAGALLLYEAVAQASG